jgi:hypothetical protein
MKLSYELDRLRKTCAQKRWDFNSLVEPRTRIFVRQYVLWIVFFEFAVLFLLAKLPIVWFTFAVFWQDDRHHSFDAFAFGAACVLLILTELGNFLRWNLLLVYAVAATTRGFCCLPRLRRQRREKDDGDLQLFQISEMVGVGKLFKVHRHLNVAWPLGAWAIVGWADLLVVRIPTLAVSAVLLLMQVVVWGGGGGDAVFLVYFAWVVLSAVYVYEVFFSMRVLYFQGVRRNLREFLGLLKTSEGLPMEDFGLQVREERQTYVYLYIVRFVRRFFDCCYCCCRRARKEKQNEEEAAEKHMKQQTTTSTAASSAPLAKKRQDTGRKAKQTTAPASAPPSGDRHRHSKSSILPPPGQMFPTTTTTTTPSSLQRGLYYSRPSPTTTTSFPSQRRPETWKRGHVVV